MCRWCAGGVGLMCGWCEAWVELVWGLGGAGSGAWVGLGVGLVPGGRGSKGMGTGVRLVGAGCSLGAMR